MKEKRSNAASSQKKVLSLRKKMYKDLQRELSREHYNRSYYEPWIKFLYGSAIIRQTGDRTFPGGDPEHPQWTKQEFWDFYEYGIEFVRGGGSVIIDKEGYWEEVDYSDPRRTDPSYNSQNYHIFYRLPFENIDTYDMETDGYYGYPTIYCDFKYDGWPYEEVVYGLIGIFKIKRKVFYLSEEMRKK